MPKQYTEIQRFQDQNNLQHKDTVPKTSGSYEV